MHLTLADGKTIDATEGHPFNTPDDSGPHGHVNNENGERLDINGNVVPPESPDAHLPINYP